VELASCCSCCEDSLIGDVRSSTVKEQPICEETASNTGFIVQLMSSWTILTKTTNNDHFIRLVSISQYSDNDSRRHLSTQLLNYPAAKLPLSSSHVLPVRITVKMHSEIIEARRSGSQSVDEAAGCRAERVSTRITAGCLNWRTVIPAVKMHVHSNAYFRDFLLRIIQCDVWSIYPGWYLKGGEESKVLGGTEPFTLS